jgi:hypothetical protein
MKDLATSQEKFPMNHIRLILIDWLKNRFVFKRFLGNSHSKNKIIPDCLSITILTSGLQKFYSHLISKFIKRKHMVYLFHAIEFIDMSDNIPLELSIHPNIKIPVSKKMERSGKIINKLLERYNPVSTRRLIDKLNKGMN